MATPRSGPNSDGKKPLVTNQACFGCTIACGRIQKIDPHHFTVQKASRSTTALRAAWNTKPPGPWAAANGVNDLDALQYANVLCNEHGMDPISFGATIGAVMELYEMGVLKKEQLGIEANFGSAPRRWPTSPRSPPRAKASARRSARAPSPADRRSTATPT